MYALVGFSFILTILFVAIEFISKTGAVGVGIIIGLAAIIHFGSDRTRDYIGATFAYGIFTVGIWAGLVKVFDLTGFAAIVALVFAQWVIIHRLLKTW